MVLYNEALIGYFIYQDIRGKKYEESERDMEDNIRKIGYDAVLKTEKTRNLMQTAEETGEGSRKLRSI